jgi:uncharacterized protein (TIGR02147 family)
MGVNPKTIYEFLDFRSFLGAWFKAEKVRRGRFSKAAVSRLLGLPNSRNFFSDILGGRPLSETFQERLVHVLALERNQARYFRALVEWEQATLPERREAAHQVLSEFRRPAGTVLATHQMEYFGDWRHGAVRALLDTDEFGDEPGRIARRLRPRLTAAEARNSLRLLERLELIARDDRGIWKPTDRAIAAPEGNGEAFVVDLQLQQIELVKQQILSKDGQPRLVATNVVSVSASGYRRLLERIDKFRAEIRALVLDDNEPIEQACQIVLAAVPINAPKDLP